MSLCSGFINETCVRINGFSMVLYGFEVLGEVAKSHTVRLLWFCNSILFYVSHIMTKPAFTGCEQQRCRSAFASAQSDQRLCRSLPE